MIARARGSASQGVGTAPPAPRTRSRRPFRPAGRSAAGSRAAGRPPWPPGRCPALTRPASSAEQRGLPRAVAAHHADPVPGRHAERDAVEQRAVRVRLGRLLQADQVHCARFTSTPETTAAPGTGPLARATDRHTPAPDSDAARSRARSALAARNTQVGPEPDTSAPSAPSSSPAARVLRSAGNSDSAAGCRSLLSARPTAGRRPSAAPTSARRPAQVQRPRAGSPRRRTRRTLVGPPASAPGPQPVQRRVHLGRGQVPVGEGQHPVVLGRRGQRRASAARPGRGPPRSRRAARRPRRCPPWRAISASCGWLEAAAPQLVAGDQGRGRVGAAAGQPGRHRDPLGDRDVHARPGSRRAGHRGAQRGHRAQRQVVPVGGTRSAPSPLTVTPSRPAGSAVTSSNSETAWKTVTRSW